MINGKRIAVVMPAYNAAKTLLLRSLNCRILSTSEYWWMIAAMMTQLNWPASLVCSCFSHDRNYGYGRNQQTCYREALAAGGDVVVIMLHPDYQYTPLLMTAMVSMVSL